MTNAYTYSLAQVNSSLHSANATQRCNCLDMGMSRNY